LKERLKFDLDKYLRNNIYVNRGILLNEIKKNDFKRSNIRNEDVNMTVSFH